ncbi:MAG: gamma-glutamylcyclotransferase family protein [Gammaproteobacteria bacterium]
MQTLIEFVREDLVLAVIIGFFLLGGFTVLREKYGFHVWYFLVVAAALIGAFITGGTDRLYFIVFLLGMATAFAEIIGKFSDEPIKSLGTPHALFYHLLNGAIAAFALQVLYVFDVQNNTAQDHLRNVIVAGLGSMLIMRSKLFNIKVSGEDVSFGPEQIIKIFFRFMEAAIDRVRAQSRIDFVKKHLGNINYNAVYDYSLTMLGAAQAMDENTRKECEERMKELMEGKLADQQLRSYRLGFLLLNTMGEDFVIKLFTNAPVEWLIRAPIPEKKSDTILPSFLNVKQDSALSALPFVGTKDETIPYLAYGTSMSGQKFRERLKWTDDVEETKFKELTKPVKCELKGYRLVFNKPSPEGPQEMGLANLMQVDDQNEKVEGVIYYLAKAAIEFLDRTEIGYHRVPIKVMVDGKEVEAQTYVAESPVEGLMPTKDYLDLIRVGAKEHQLSANYLARLESLGDGTARP